jgi:hypothetical protein
MPMNQNADDPVVILGRNYSNLLRNRSSLTELLGRLALEKTAYMETAKAYHNGASQYGRDGEAIGQELTNVADTLARCHGYIARAVKHTDGLDW